MSRVVSACQHERIAIRNLLAHLLVWADRNAIDYTEHEVWQHTLTFWAKISLDIAEEEGRNERGKAYERKDRFSGGK